MKAHLTKVSLALLSTVFLLGCQEQGSGPVGPDGLGPEFGHKTSHNPGGGGEDPQEFTVTLTGGMLASPFPVGAPKDTRKTLKVSNHNQPKQTITMNFDLESIVNSCVGFVGTNGGTEPNDTEIKALKAELTQDADDAKLVMNIDKANLDLGSPDGHALIITYDDKEDLGSTSIMLGGWPGPVQVDVDDTGNVFTFTGAVVVWDRNGGNDNRLISCPGTPPGATVVVTLAR